MGLLILNKYINQSFNFYWFLSLILILILHVSINLWFIKRPGIKKRNGLAFIFSLMNIGAGQFYKRNKKRGVLFSCAFVGLFIYFSLLKSEVAAEMITMLVFISPLEAFITGSSINGSSNSGDREYDSLDYVMDNMNDQFHN